MFPPFQRWDIFMSFRSLHLSKDVKDAQRRTNHFPDVTHDVMPRCHHLSCSTCWVLKKEAFSLSPDTCHHLFLADPTTEVNINRYEMLQLVQAPSIACYGQIRDHHDGIM